MFERDEAIKRITHFYKKDPSIVKDSFLISIGKLIDSCEKGEIDFKELLDSISSITSSNRFAISIVEGKYKELFN